MDINTHLNQSENYCYEINNRKYIVYISRDLDALTPHYDAWNNLVYHSPQQLPMLSYAWIYSYFKHRIRDNETSLCLFAYENDTLVGVLPLIERYSSFLGINIRTLHGPFDDQTNTCDILIKNDKPEVISLLIRSAFRASPYSQYIKLDRISECSPTLKDKEKTSYNYLINSYASGLGAYLPVNKTFRNYTDHRQSLSKNFRSNLNKARNKINKLPNLTVDFKKSNDADPKFIDTFMEVESRNWKGKAGSAIINSEINRNFYKTLSELLFQAGWLQWHFLNTGDKAIAANLAVEMKDSIVLWKLGYDEEYSKCSPGSYLLEKLLEEVYADDDIKEINLTTDRPWYDNWSMEKRTYYDVYLYPRRLLSIVLFYIPKKISIYIRTFEKLKQIVKFILRKNTKSA